MRRPSLLLITNPEHDEAAEDRLLGSFLEGYYRVEFSAVRDAPRAVRRFDRCLLRNAWPSSAFVDELRLLERIIRSSSIRAYNPPHRRGYVEDKSYLPVLWKLDYPVIPSVDNRHDLDRLGHPGRFVIKPKNGCSSDGVEFVTPSEVEERPLENYLIQPEVDFTCELSFFFIDNEFAYAVVSAGRLARWELREYDPTSEEVAWARRFVRWNAMPYGLQRIDACRLRSGEMLLMEIEDQFPLLSLADLSAARRSAVLRRLAASLLRHLGGSRSDGRLGPRRWEHAGDPSVVAG